MDNEKQTSTVNKPEKHKFPFSYINISSDLLLRFIFLWLYATDICNIWIFWICQIVLVPSITLIVFSGKEKKCKEQIRKEQEIAENVKIEIEVQGNAFSVLFALSAITIGTIITWKLFSSIELWLQILLTIITCVVYGFYILVIFMASYPKVKGENQDKQKKENINSDLLSVDGNDEKLVELEISLSKFSRKVDSYTLESALLGALTFSGFLAILALDNSINNNIQIFLSQISAISHTLINFNALPTISLNQQTIISALAMETIICSLFFLLVIVSRIRFHDALGEAELFIKIARELNNKVEEYNINYQQEPSKVMQERVDFLNARINEKLKIGEQRKKDLESIVVYMSFVRNIGLFLFVLILSTAACIVSYKLSIGFFVLYVISYTYQQFDTWAKKRSWRNPILK